MNKQVVVDVFSVYETIKDSMKVTRQFVNWRTTARDGGLLLRSTKTCLHCITRRIFLRKGRMMLWIRC
jgi:hypothetical protein